MIDFDALVLLPAQTTFGVAIIVTPTASQPGVAAYAARGVFEALPQIVLLEGGEELATTRRTLSIRVSEYPIPPRQGDSVMVGTENYLIDSATIDGQGGAELSLRATR